MTDSAGSEKLRVGLVEDHPVFREGLRAVLQSDPSIELVGEAGDHDQAVKLAEDTAPHLLLVDISLGRGRNGIALTRTLSERRPDIRVLVLSVEDGADYVRGAYEAGARGYVMKESPLRQLLAAIHAVAAGGTFWPAGIDLGSTQGALTRAQLRVAQLLAQGLVNKDVAGRLDIARRTVECHRAAIYERTRTTSAVEIRLWLEARGLLIAAVSLGSLLA